YMVAGAASRRRRCYAAGIDSHMPSTGPSARDVLREVFGYAEFRPGQEKLITTVLGGRDCIGVMPTGAGKSLTYQIPARLRPGGRPRGSRRASLMKERVGPPGRAGSPPAPLTPPPGGAPRRDRIVRARRGEYELIYVAPEGLDGGLRGALAGVRVSLVAVD